MGQTNATRQSDYITAPTAPAAITVSAAPAVIDLSTLPMGASKSAIPGQGYPTPVGSYVTIQAEVADIYIVFGPSAASVTTTNAPVKATVGTVNASGAYAVVAGTAFRIPADQVVALLIEPASQFMGFVGSSAGTMRLYHSSPTP